MAEGKGGAVLAGHRYGKSRVRLMRVLRGERFHELYDWTVEVLLTGDFAEVFTHGDNGRIVATDTMKNTVYFVARRSESRSMEEFAQELVEFLLGRNAQVSGVEVTVESHLWKRITVDGAPYPTAFMKGSEERGMTHVERVQGGTFRVRSGFAGMTVLKTAQSGFVGFLRDELTTLPETTDRLFGTAVTAEWRYGAEALAAGVAFEQVRTEVREGMVTAFARHDSLSVQQTLFAMAEGALAGCGAIEEVFLRMPNKHNLLVDLWRFGMDNPNQIFVPTEEPQGMIEATVRRG